jgi:hypothetical protein
MGNRATGHSGSAPAGCRADAPDYRSRLSHYQWIGGTIIYRGATNETCRVRRLQKVSNGERTNFDRSVYDGCGDSTGFVAMLDALADGGTVLTFSKRGRS